MAFENKQIYNNSTFHLKTSLKDFLLTFDRPGASNNVHSAQTLDTRNTFECIFLLNKGTHPFENLGKLVGNISLQESFNLTKYIYRITIPNLTLPSGEKVQTIIGDFPVNGKYVQPDNNNLNIDFINTTSPLFEHFIYPWMREVSSPLWIYNDFPFTKATIEVSLTEHSNISYVFYGCRPCQIETYNPSQDVPTTITRQATFTFDFFQVKALS